MAIYGQPLNQDSNGIRTSARYDAVAAIWLHDSAQYRRNSGGLWVPVGLGDYATPSQPAAVAVATTTTPSAAATAGRLYLLLVNDSDTTIYVMLGANAVLNRGIRLNANGGSYEMSMALGNVYTGAVNAIHGSTGTKNLLVTEGV